MKVMETIIPGMDTVVYGKDQPEYQCLPTIRNIDNALVPVTCRFSFTDEERMMVIAGGDLYLTVATFGRALSPVKVQVFSTPEEAGEALHEQGYV
jgi:hypothetical protein